MTCVPGAARYEMTRCRPGTATAAAFWNGPASAVHRLRAAPRAGHKLRPHRGLQPRRLDAGNRAHLVLVRRVARDADRAEHRATLILDQHPARHRYEAAVAHG